MQRSSIPVLVTIFASAFATAQTPPRLAKLNTSESIVDFLKAHKLDHSLEARNKLYQERFGKVDYSGTHAQNVRLLESLLLENAVAAKAAFCAIDETTVALKGAGTRSAFDALPDTAVRIATLNRNTARAEGKPSYYVVLSARETRLPESVGHAWVAFGIRGFEKGDPAQCIGSAFGSYPQEDRKAPLSLFQSVPGKIVQGWLANGTSAEQSEKVRLVVEVTEEAYFAARNVVAATEAGKKYELLTRDCAELTREVAKAIGLKVGERKLLPTQVVEALIRDNLPSE